MIVMRKFGVIVKILPGACADPVSCMRIEVCGAMIVLPVARDGGSMRSISYMNY